MTIYTEKNMEISELDKKVELQNQNVGTMQSDIQDIKQQLKDLPDIIAKRMCENNDLKIQIEVQKVEQKTKDEISAIYKWVAGLSITAVGELILIILQFVINRSK